MMKKIIYTMLMEIRSKPIQINKIIAHKLSRRNGKY